MAKVALRRAKKNPGLSAGVLSPPHGHPCGWMPKHRDRHRKNRIAQSAGLVKPRRGKSAAGEHPGSGRATSRRHRAPRSHPAGGGGAGGRRGRTQRQRTAPAQDESKRPRGRAQPRPGARAEKRRPQGRPRPRAGASRPRSREAGEGERKGRPTAAASPRPREARATARAPAAQRGQGQRPGGQGAPAERESAQAGPTEKAPAGAERGGAGEPRKAARAASAETAPRSGGGRAAPERTQHASAALRASADAECAQNGSDRDHERRKGDQRKPAAQRGEAERDRKARTPFLRSAVGAGAMVVGVGGRRRQKKAAWRALRADRRWRPPAGPRDHSHARHGAPMVLRISAAMGACAGTPLLDIRTLFHHAAWHNGRKTLKR